MQQFRQLLLAYSTAALVYILVVTAVFRDQLTLANGVSVISVLVIFLLSGLIVSFGKSPDQKENAQKFILATTVQLLIALFYVLIAKFVVTEQFKAVSTHFLIMFFLLLLVQAFFLVRGVRSGK